MSNASNSDAAQRRLMPPQTRHGPGHHSAFCCARCAAHHLVMGRRMRRVQGVRSWVCAACVVKEPA